MPRRSVRSPRSLPRRKRASKQDVPGYNDVRYDYRKYWRGRAYEHAAEEIAIRQLLDGRHFKRAADIGGGYGRLSKLLLEYADDVTLVDASQRQLDLAKKFLVGQPNVEYECRPANKLVFRDDSIGLILMLRVLSHITNPSAEFDELARVLSRDGLAIIEVANHGHALNVLKYSLAGMRVPTKAVTLRVERDQTKPAAQLIAHNPHTIIRQLTHAGLKVVDVRSVSNLRHAQLKRRVPLPALIFMERWLQRPLAYTYFGPSIFFLVKKA